MADKKTAPLLLNVDASEVLTQTGELLNYLNFQPVPFREFLSMSSSCFLTVSVA
jgi:hypothetical protein